VEYEKFKKMLKDSNLTIKDFSKISNTKYRTCISWSLSGREVPTWVEPFIELYVKNVECLKYRDSIEIVFKDLNK
jgi:predicted transcriptional regulator